MHSFLQLLGSISMPSVGTEGRRRRDPGPCLREETHHVNRKSSVWKKTLQWKTNGQKCICNPCAKGLVGTFTKSPQKSGRKPDATKEVKRNSWFIRKKKEKEGPKHAGMGGPSHMIKEMEPEARQRTFL